MGDCADVQRSSQHKAPIEMSGVCSECVVLVLAAVVLVAFVFGEVSNLVNRMPASSEVFSVTQRLMPSNKNRGIRVLAGILAR